MGIAYRLRVRTADNTSDLLVVTSVRGGTNPWIAEPPKGDGASIDPLTGVSTSGKYTIRIIDGITSGTSRIFTSLLTDSNGLPQLARLRAFIESSTDGFATSACLIPGYLDTYQLSSDIVWDVTVIDAAALEHKILAFGPHYVSGQYESLKAYLTRWPYRGCIFGGPIRTPATDPAPRKFGQLVDRNGWTFDSPGGTTRELDFVSGYQSPGYQVTKKASDVADKVNTAAAPYFDPTASAVVQFLEFPPAPDGTPAYTGVVIQVGVAAGFTDGTPTDDEYYCATAVYSFDPSSRSNTAYMLVTPAVGGKNQIILTSSLASRFVGQRVRARCFTALPSAASPIYWDGHPVDLITTLGEEAGFTYDSTSVEATRHALGDDLRLAIRVTAIQNLGDFLEAAVYGPFGIGTRSNAAGNIELYSTRIIESGAVGALPTITNADIVRGTAKPYQLDPSTAIKTVTFGAESWTFGSVSVGTDDSKYPADGVLVRSVTQQYVNGDLGAPETDLDQGFNIPGMPHRNGQWGINWSGPNKSDWASAAAAEIFDRWGRGIVETDITGVHGGSVDGLKLGDLAIVAIKQLPNNNKRLVDDGTVPGRVMQVVFADPTPNQTELHLLDGGPNAQPLTTLPAFSIAAVSSRVASITITNAAALNTAGLAVRVRMAVTTGAAAASTAYADVAYFPAGQVPTGAVSLPAVTSGSTVFVIGRSEQIGSHRPSAYSTPVSVTLAALDQPTISSAIADPSDGSHATLSWTNGANAAAALIDIYLRKSTDGVAANTLVITLPAGSVKYTLEHLTPGTGYTATVQARDPLSGDTSLASTVTFTAGATAVTLPPPLDARVFAGRQNPVFGFPQQDGVYGLAVAAVAFPGFVEFWEGIETAVGSGSYGTATLVATTPSVLGDWTLFERVAPNDGLRRQLTARHVRDGATASAFTAALVVLPWTAVPLPLAVFTNAVPTASISLVSQTAANATLALSGVGSGALSYRVRQSNGTTMPAFGSFISSPALPQNLVVTRLPVRSVYVELQVEQADGGLSLVATATVEGQPALLDPVSGGPIRAVPYDDGQFAPRSSSATGDDVHPSVLIGGVGAATLANMGNRLFSEAWDNDFGVNWTQVAGAGTIAYQTAAVAGGIQGPRVALFSDTVEANAKIRIPINPNKLYKLVCRYAQTGLGTSNPPYTYLGFTGYLGDGSVANNNGGNIYCMAAGLTLPAGGFVEYVSWVGKGATQAFTDPSSLATSDSGTPTAPQPFNVGTTTIAPLFLANYPGAGATAGAGSALDYWQMWEFDEDGTSRVYAGLTTVGDVGRPVPLVHAVANVPAISATSGKLLPSEPLDGTTGTPVHTQHAVAILTDGPAVTDGAGRAVAGLAASTGLVALDVPLAHAAANLPALSPADGKLNPAVALHGVTGTPVHTGLNVSALANGPTVEAGAARANAAIDSSQSFYVPAGQDVKIGTQGSPTTTTKTQSWSSSAFGVDDSTKANNFNLSNGLRSQQGTAALPAFIFAIPVPIGTELTSVSFPVHVSAAESNFQNFNIVKVSPTGTATTIGTFSSTLPTGWGTVTIPSLSEVIASGFKYFAVVSLSNGGSGVPNNVGFQGLDVTYDVSTYSQSL